MREIRRGFDDGGVKPPGVSGLPGVAGAATPVRTFRLDAAFDAFTLFLRCSKAWEKPGTSSSRKGTTTLS